MLPRLIRRWKKPFTALVAQFRSQCCRNFCNAVFLGFLRFIVQAVGLQICTPQLDYIANTQPGFKAHPQRQPGVRCQARSQSLDLFRVDVFTPHFFLLTFPKCKIPSSCHALGDEIYPKGVLFRSSYSRSIFESREAFNFASSSRDKSSASCCSA